MFKVMPGNGGMNTTGVGLDRVSLKLVVQMVFKPLKIPLNPRILHNVMTGKCVHGFHAEEPEIHVGRKKQILRGEQGDKLRALLLRGNTPHRIARIVRYLTEHCAESWSVASVVRK